VKPVGPAEPEADGGRCRAEAEGGARASVSTAKNTSPLKRAIELFISRECRTE
jgi:hypothetical protein